MMFLRLLAFALACVSANVFGAAVAAEYPVRPVHWIVAFPAGGANDIVARIIDRNSTRLNSSHIQKSRMPSSA